MINIWIVGTGAYNEWLLNVWIIMNVCVYVIVGYVQCSCIGKMELRIERINWITVFKWSG